MCWTMEPYVYRNAAGEAVDRSPDGLYGMSWPRSALSVCHAVLMAPCFVRSERNQL